MGHKMTENYKKSTIHALCVRKTKSMHFAIGDVSFGENAQPKNGDSFGGTASSVISLCGMS